MGGASKSTNEVSTRSLAALTLHFLLNSNRTDFRNRRKLTATPESCLLRDSKFLRIMFGIIPTVKLSRRRWILNGLMSLSTLLCLAIAGLGVRSCQTEDIVEYSGRHSSVDIISARGEILAAWIREEIYPGDVTGFHSFSDRAQWRISDGLHAKWQIGFWGFGAASDKQIRPIYTAYLPIWFVAITCASLSLTCFFLARRLRRPPTGFCAKCGYDLRASPNRCPECGAVPTKP